MKRAILVLGISGIFSALLVLLDYGEKNPKTPEEVMMEPAVVTPFSESQTYVVAKSQQVTGTHLWRVIVKRENDEQAPMISALSHKGYQQGERVELLEVKYDESGGTYSPRWCATVLFVK